MSHPEPATHRSSSPDKVANHVLDGIKSGRFVPGQRLIEADLSETLYTSRGPIREAFKRLAAEGVLTLIPHRGAYVATENIRNSDNRQRFKHVYNELIANTSSADIHELLDRRAEFYDTLVTLSGNSELKRFVPIPQTNLLRTQFVRHFSSDERQRELHEYSQIATHILNGDSNLAEDAMRLMVK